MTGEFDLLAQLLPTLATDGPAVPVGVGDDGAVVRIGDEAVVVVVDAMVEGVHVDLSLSAPEDLGWKALAVNLSDVAAMGGVANAAVVALTRGPATDDETVLRVYDGLRTMASSAGVHLVGGDTTDGPGLVVGVTVVGRLLDRTRPLRRDRARIGDLVAVFGPLGLAAAGLRGARAGLDELLAEEPDLLQAHRRPVPLTAAASVLVSAGVGCAVDVSDGLGRDLGHVARASDVGIDLSSGRLPQHGGVQRVARELGLDPVDLVVGGGDDYAIACTFPHELLPRVDTAAEAAGLRVRLVGEVVDDHRGRVLLDRVRDVTRQGWEHGATEEEHR